MKTYGKNGEMWARLCEWDCWDKAQKRSRLHKSGRSDIMKFEKNRDVNLRRIMNFTIAGKYHCSRYRTMTIYEPKQRLIYIVPYNPDRIVHHAVVSVLVPYYMRMFDKDSYSCIEGRGQTAASCRTMEMVRRYKWCLESDVHHCFPSVNLDLLSKMHHERFRDKKFLELNDKIIYGIIPGGQKENSESLFRHTLLDKNGEEFEVSDGSNAPIGNYTSQWYMNFFLTAIDNFCSHTLNIQHVRFCDNLNLYSNNLDDIKRAKDAVQEFFLTHLSMTLSKINIRRTDDGIDFVGYRHFPNGKILVRKSTVKRQKKNIYSLPEKFDAGFIDKDTMRSVIDSTLGWWKHAKTYNLKKATGIYGMRRHYCGA